MKRVLAFLPALCLLLTLCACGSKLTPPEPALTPTPAAPVAPPIPEVPVPAGSSDAPPPGPSDGPDAPRPVVPVGGDALRSSLPAPYFFMVPMGESHSADFDGDGAAETVCVTLETSEFGAFWLHITLDGEPLTDDDWQDETLLTLTSYDFYEPAYVVADLDTTDGLLEIAIQDWGPSDDLTTQFFRIEDGKLRDLGTVAGMLWHNSGGGVHLKGDGSVSSYLRLNVLHTWFAPCSYELDDEGMFVPVEKELYYASVTVQALCDLTAYPMSDGTPFVLPSGTLLRIYATDNKEWLEADFVDYERFGYGGVRLHLTDFYSLETPDGPVYGSDALLGLSFYD